MNAPGSHQTAADDQIDLAIDGMTCASCVLRVEKALAGVPGVKRASVNLATQRAHLDLVAGQTDAQRSAPALIAAVQKAGYEASQVQTDIAPNDTLGESRSEEARHLQRTLWISLALSLPVFVLEMGSLYARSPKTFLMASVSTLSLTVVLVPWALM